VGVAENGGYVLQYFKTSTDMTEIDKYFEHDIDSVELVPHSSIFFQDRIFSSVFRGKIYNVNEELYDLEGIYRYSMMDFYAGLDILQKMDVQIKSKIYSESIPDLVYSEYFDNAGLIRYINDNFDPVIQNGRVLVLDINSKELIELNTTYPSPGHFVFHGNSLYASGHNIGGYNGKLYYYGQAGIDKFKFADGNFVHDGIFNDSKGFRFTSHRVFDHRDKTFLATFAHPNRLMVADTVDMSLIFYDDIGVDVLSGVEDILYFHNEEAGFEEHYIQTLEASEDGEYLVFIYKDDIMFYSVENREIVNDIRYITPGDVDLEQLFFDRIHSDYLLGTA
jgi:hypothetical protein